MRPEWVVWAGGATCRVDAVVLEVMVVRELRPGSRCWALVGWSTCSWRSGASVVLDAPGRSHQFGRQRGTSTRVINQQVPVRVVRQIRREFDEFAQIGT